MYLTYSLELLDFIRMYTCGIAILMIKFCYKRCSIFTWSFQHYRVFLLLTGIRAFAHGLIQTPQTRDYERDQIM